MPKKAKHRLRAHRFDIHDVAHLPLVALLPRSQQKRLGGKTIVIPNPHDVERLVCSIRKGRVVTQAHLCAKLAEMAGAHVACPQITGLFLRLIAIRSEELLESGKKKVPPYWRVVGPDGVLNDHFPGGAVRHARKLMDDGLPITGYSKRRAPQVDDYQKYLHVF